MRTHRRALPATADRGTTQRHNPPTRDVSAQYDALFELQQSTGNRAVQALFEQQAHVVDEAIAGQSAPLDPSLRNQMERRFGEDFSRVRIHDDTRAHDSANALSARAYTVGNDIVFSAERYQPTSHEGKRLVAHELAHVIQQARGGGAPQLDGQAPHEQDADAASASAVEGTGPVSVTTATGVGIARDEEKKNKKSAANPRLETFYMPAFHGNRAFSQRDYEGMPKGVWPYDSHLSNLWLDVDTSRHDGYATEDFKIFADTVKEYQMAVMGLTWKGAHGVVDHATAASLIAHPIAKKKSTTTTTAPTPVSMFDSDYKLADGHTMGYDPKTQIVTISPDDKEHLVRLQGYYFFLAHDVITLIAPPEARTTSDTLDQVLVPMSKSELRMFDGNSNPAARIARIIKRWRGWKISSSTASTQSDYDYAIDKYTPEGPKRTALERARRRAIATRQRMTIEDAAQEGKSLPMRKLEGMDPGTLINQMKVGERMSWYIQKLGPYQDQLYQSALEHNIPMQLLAAIILNELSDIGAIDLLQDGTPVADSGSLGIAQIQVSTARKYRLVDVTDEEALGAYERRDGSFPIQSGGPVDDATKLRRGRVYRTAEQLQKPQFAIEAAAREIARLLTKMGQNLDKPWQKNSGFRAPGPSGPIAQDYIPKQGDTRTAEALLLQLVAGAYNSPDMITTTQDPEQAFSNGFIHGWNAREIAFDLFDAQLFRAQ